MFKIENLSACYGEKNVLKNISFELKENCISAFCGLNGSGKSTLLSLMSGIGSRNLKFSGNIMMDGKSVLQQNEKDNAKKISYLVQNEISVWNKTVEDFIFEGRFVHKKWYQDASKNSDDKKIVYTSMELLSILNLKNRNISNLSGGEFQKVRIARCLAQQTKYIFLDEPLSSIDVSYQKEFMGILKNLCMDGKTICLSIHDLNLAFQFADQILLLQKDGQCTYGPCEKIASEKSTIEKTFQQEFSFFNHPITGKKQIW